MWDVDCIYFSRFEPTVDRGGGSRRTVQVLRAFDELDVRFVTATQPYPFDREFFENIRSPGGGWFNKKRITRGEYPYWSKTRREVVYRLRNISTHWAKSIDRHHMVRLVLMDDPIYFAPLAEKLFKLRIPVAAVCHNIETLVASNVDAAHRIKLFKRELDLFARCETVITISREDTTLLKNFNPDINAVYFPYHPVEEIRERLLTIRKKRKKTAKENYLIMGTAINSETREGMQRMIRLWETAGASAYGGKLLVAGYKTDTFLPEVKNSKNVEFLGPLDNHALDKHLAEVNACICYQEKGGGALTRICELLTAGVPVVANSHAARSYYDKQGVIEFQAPDLLGEALSRVGKVDGHIPLPPAPDTSILLHQMKTAMHRGPGSPPKEKNHEK